MFDKCAPVAPGSVSINHKHGSGQKAGDEEIELYILNDNRQDCGECVCILHLLGKKKKKRDTFDARLWRISFGSV